MPLVPFAVSDPGPSLDHWPLVPQCGICGTRCVKDDQFVALSGIPDGSAFASRTETMPFLAPSTVKAYKKSYLCRWAGCKTCAVGPDVVTVHADCLEVYLEHAASYEERKEPTKEKDGNQDKETGKGDDKSKKDTTVDKKRDETERAALQRLWIASSWRTPWKKAPFLSLLQCDNARMSMPSPALLHRLGLPGMARMPPELASTISELSKDSPLWRLNAAARLALSLAEYEKTETYDDDPAALPASILLSEVEAWERGRLLVRRVVSDEKKPVLAEETTATDSFIRLAIDTYGLLRIERLPVRPAYNGTTSAGKLAYTLCETKTLNGAKVHFQLGLGRIELPAGLPGLQIWDTPAPPPIEDVAYMRKQPKRVSPTSYLHVVDLEAITGLTLLSDGNVLGLHAHTAAEPSATVTAARMALPTARVAWQYMPLAPGDHIEAVGVRKEGYSPQLSQDELTIMFRKRLSGDTLLGYSFYDSPSETILTAPSEQPRALVYSAVNTINGVITDVGVYNVAAAPDVTAAARATSVRNGTRRHCFNHSAYPDEQLTEDTFQSNVPLAGVTYMQVYTTRDTGLLRGIILTYDNGGQRALGMCCVATDIDAVREYAHPVRLCFKSNRETGVTRLRIITEGDLGTPAADGHDDCEGGEDPGEGEEADDPYAIVRACCLMTGRLEFAVDSDRLCLEHFAEEEELDKEKDPDDEDVDVW